MKKVFVSLFFIFSIFLFPNFLENAKALEGNIKIKYSLEKYNSYTENEIKKLNELFDTLETNYPNVYYVAVELTRYIKIYYSTNPNFLNNEGATLYAFNRSNGGDTGTTYFGFRFNSSFNSKYASVYVKDNQTDNYKNISYIIEHLKNKGSLSQVFKNEGSSDSVTYFSNIAICLNNTCTSKEENYPYTRIVRTNIPNADVFLGVNEASINKYLKTDDIYDSLNITLYDDKTIIPIGGTIPILLKKEVKPTVSINSSKNTDENNNTMSYDLTLHFSEWDTDKYYYQYSYNGKAWASIYTQDHILNINQNLTVIARIMDKETNSFVSSASFTISDISSETLPKITFKKVTSDVLEGQSCYVTKNGKNYSVCEVIEHSIENYNSNHHDIYIKTKNDVDFRETTWNARHLISENGAIVLKVVDRTTHEMITSATFNVSSISSVEDLGIYSTFETVFYKQNLSLEARYTFYNFNPEIHKMYYSIDSPNKLDFQEITDYIYNSESTLTYKNFEFYKNATLYITIYDNENNLVYSVSSSINYDYILSQNEDPITKELRKVFQPFLDLINDKFPIINQLGEIIQSFKYDKDNIPKPSLTIDFSFLGGEQFELFSEEFINAYNQYRDILYFFIYLGVGFIVIPKTIGYVKGYFGGGSND